MRTGYRAGASASERQIRLSSDACSAGSVRTGGSFDRHRLAQLRRAERCFIVRRGSGASHWSLKPGFRIPLSRVHWRSEKFPFRRFVRMRPRCSYACYRGCGETGWRMGLNLESCIGSCCRLWPCESYRLMSAIVWKTYPIRKIGWRSRNRFP